MNLPKKIPCISFPTVPTHPFLKIASWSAIRSGWSSADLET
jgi:hypothetical protein